MVGDDSFTVHPRRGEYLLLDKECGSIVSHTIFTTPSKMGKGILVSPTVDGNALIGPTAVDIDDKENKDVYMIALRDDDGTLIGYYEKHEYRDMETMSLYDF